MKKILEAGAAIFFICLFLAGCSLFETGKDEKTVVQINRFKMTLEDWGYELKNAPYDDAVLLKTEKGLRKYLDQVIEKEILLQEAQRQGIDREKDFMKSIENYWEQALLKVLLERKSKEILSSIEVYDNEIESYYKNSGESLPLSKVKDEIRNIIKNKKETEAMNAWINELRKRAYIKVNEDVLDGLI